MSLEASRPAGQDAPGEHGLVVVGRKEYLAFPEWGLAHVRAKVDTGAYSSALDVAGYDLFEGETGLRARLRLTPRRRRPGQPTEVEAPVVRLVTVTSSSGAREKRPLIETTIRLGPVLRRVRLTLANRTGLRCPMLLGRQALAGAFLVDVRGKYLLGR
jgi:hypothetical protein